MEVALKLIEYFCMYFNFHLYYSRSKGLAVFTSFMDADWAGAKNRKSIEGYITFLENAPISWQSKLQQTVALSPIKSKYMTTNTQDNKGTITLAENPTIHNHTKHIDI
jgi:hypothetical protein